MTTHHNKPTSSPLNLGLSSYYYPQNALDRNIAQFCERGDETPADRYFGDREWRTVYAEWQRTRAPGGLHPRLMDYYKERLRSLGYAEVLRDDETGDEPLIRNSDRNAPLYRLLFASKHPLGHEFWHKVTQRDLHGQRRLL